MRVVHVNSPAEDGPSGLLSADTARLRIRPGENPAWVAVSTASTRFCRWRSECERVGMPLDGLMAARLELRLAVDRAKVSLRVLNGRLHRLDAGATPLPPPPLRTWVALLSGRVTQPHIDELPEVVLPARLARALAPGWLEACERIPPEAALRWERTSAVHGLTISELAWSASYRTPLSAAH